MRQSVTAERLREFMRALGASAKCERRVYFTGGASAVLIGWRAHAIDIDMKTIPEDEELFAQLPRTMPVEFLTPADFIPELPGWRERSMFIAREGLLDFYHYDFYAQYLAKIERGHVKDLADLRGMEALVQRDRLMELFEAIEPSLIRYPAIDPRRFRRALEATIQ